MNQVEARNPIEEHAGAVQLFGREHECERLARLVGGANESRSAVLLLRGEAGVGKSALLDFARGIDARLRVLRAVGVEPETELPFAGLHRLLRPVFDLIDRIPDVQAQALRSALGIAPGVAENRFVIGLAVLNLLAEVATDGPTLCLLDDAQWLDRPSLDALTFVARRLDAEGIVMLFCVREGDVRTFPGSDLPSQEIGGLDAEQAERLLAERFDGQIAPETQRAIVESAQGNPLALLEIPAALSPAQLSGREALPNPLPIGRHLEDILLAGVRRLTPSAQMLLLVAAAEGSGEADVIVSAAGTLGIPSSALMEAEASGMIHAEGTGLAFRHPILRSAIYQGATLADRQAAHRALVEVLQEESEWDRRTWHRAALAQQPDDEIAEELERAADRARSRGGHAAALMALRRAAELTTSDVLRQRRFVSAAQAAWDSGQPREASALLRAVDAEKDPATDAEVSHLRGAIAFDCGSPVEGAAVLLEGAGRAAQADPQKALQMILDAAMCANYAGDMNLLIEAGRLASTLPVSEVAPETSMVELLSLMVGMLQGEDSTYRAGIARALDRVADTTDPRWLIWAGGAASIVGDRTRDDALRQRAEAIARGTMAVGSLAMALARTAWSDLRYERLVAASNHAEEGLRLALETSLPNPACNHRAVLAWVAAVRGDEATCTSLSGQASETAMAHGLAAQNALANWSLGLLQLGLGHWESAVTRLQALESGAPGTSHPFVARKALPDLVEAAVRAGRHETAGWAASRVADYAQEGDPYHELAIAARCRALTASSHDAKEKLLSEALVFHDRDPLPFARARTQLLLGEHLRRERRRKEARVPLHAALIAFDQLGASPWAERTRRELRATGQTVGRRDEESRLELTHQERQVAEIVARGATNREAAAELYLSPRTVEYHLRSLFSKLGISSRAELARVSLDEV